VIYFVFVSPCWVVSEYLFAPDIIPANQARPAAAQPNANNLANEGAPIIEAEAVDAGMDD
jgi:hypothetical protein